MEVEARLSSRSKGAEESGEAKGEDGEEKEPEKFPDEQFPYMVNWAKVMLATTFGMCCAAHLTPAPTRSPTPNPNSSPSPSPSPSPIPSPSQVLRRHPARRAPLLGLVPVPLLPLLRARPALLVHPRLRESRRLLALCIGAAAAEHSLYLPYVSPMSPLYLPSASARLPPNTHPSPSPSPNSNPYPAAEPSPNPNPNHGHHPNSSCLPNAPHLSRYLSKGAAAAHPLL